MDRKYLTPPFDMCEYIFGKRFDLGGVDFNLDDDEEASLEMKSDPKRSLEREEPDQSER